VGAALQLLGSSPTTAGLQRSLRDIQAEQEQMRAGAGRGGARSVVVMGSSPPTNKWYVPEMEQAQRAAPQSLRSIATEENAIRALEVGGGLGAMRRVCTAAIDASQLLRESASGTTTVRQ
jgi:predicted Rossmann-fold nucleotide-binding protein